MIQFSKHVLSNFWNTKSLADKSKICFGLENQLHGEDSEKWGKEKKINLTLNLKKKKKKSYVDTVVYMAVNKQRKQVDKEQEKWKGKRHCISFFIAP